MSSPCTFKINKLRRKNRALLEQLESNSALLECRLKKLKHTAKTEKHSDKSWEDLPPSPLKRKFKSWKARNYSGQISAVLQRDMCDCTQNSSDNVDAEVQLKENMEEGPVTSPAKRTRHNVLIVSNPRKSSSPKRHKKIRTPLKSSSTINVTETPRKCCKCHCRKVNEMSLSDEESTSSPTCVCNCSNVRACKRYSVEEEEEKACMNKKTLEAAKSMLNYSPESVFLRRLKKRSQTLENLFSPGNVRKSTKVFPTCGKSLETVSNKISEMKKEKVNPEKSSPVKYEYFDNAVEGKVTAGSIGDVSSRPAIKKSPIRDASSRKIAKSPVRDIPSKTTARSATTKSELRDFFTKSPPRDIPSRHIIAKSPLHGYSSDCPPTMQTKSTRNTRKRVCYRKNCYCRVPQRKSKPKKKTVEDVKENLTEEESLIKQDKSSSEESPGPQVSHCCCYHQQKSPPPKAPLLMTDTISGLVDNEAENKYIRGECCGCDKGSRWFNKLNEFRQSHYFDCHAHPSSLSLDSARNWNTMDGQPLGHKCIHKYTVDDRLFAKPLYSDHRNNSRCTICHLPFEAAKARKEGLLPITLPSKLDDPVIEVTVPFRKSKRTSPRASLSSSYKKSSHFVTRGKTNTPKVKSSLTSRTIGDFKAWMPPPADSLALRYQKGVIK